VPSAVIGRGYRLLIWCLLAMGDEQNPTWLKALARNGSSVSALGIAPSSPFGLLYTGLLMLVD
jgi:hypothetical protein